MTENFPNLVLERVTQVQEAQMVPSKIKPKMPTPIHIKLKIAKLKDKERFLNAARENQLVTYKGPPIRLSADFSIERL